jgi:hypothetical protein
VSIRLPTASYNQPSRNSARLLNCYAQASTGKVPVEVVGTPGVVTYRALEAPGRGLAVQSGEVLAVAGNALYNVLNGSEVGTITGSGVLTFAAGVSQLVTDNGYIYQGGTVAAITDADLPLFAAVDFVDGYVLGVERGTGKFYGSALNDSSDWAGLDFATAEGAPDNLVTLKVDHREVILFGTDTTEIWWNSGAAGFPFERTSGGFIELGCCARLGVAKADNSVFWLASDRTIRRLSGRTPVKVSQIGVEEALAAYTTVNDCEAISYTYAGNIIVQFHFPTEGKTWCLNVTTAEWFEQDYRFVAAIQHDGKTWVQAEDGTVGYLSPNVYTVFGENVTREVTTGHVFAGHQRVFVAQLDAILRTGDIDPDLIPMLQLDVSYDGANTWHGLPSRELGRMGGYRQVCRWTRLGVARDIVVRVRVSDAVPFHLMGVEVEAEGGAK